MESHRGIGSGSPHGFAPREFVPVVITEGRERGRVGESDETVVIYNPDRLGRRLQHSREEVLSIDVEAS